MAAESKAPATLYEAAKRGALEEVESLLATKPPPESFLDEDGRPALSVAAAGGHVKVVKSLLDGGAEDKCANGWTAACHAAFYGHLEVLTVLAEKLGADSVIAPAGARSTPFLLACMKARADCATFLVNTSAAVLKARDGQGRTALMLAASNGSAELIRWLVTEHGAPLEDASANGKTALLWAVTAHKATAVSELVQLGADPHVRELPDPEAAIIPGKDRTIGENAIEIASSSGRDPTQRFVIKYLEAYGAHREQSPGVPMSPMETFPHVTHVKEFVAKEAAEAAAKEAAAAAAATATPAVSTDESDIFGADDVPSGAPAPASKMLIEEVDADDAESSHKQAAHAEMMTAKSESAADLDALD